MSNFTWFNSNKVVKEGGREIKPGKQAWEIDRGTQVHRCPAVALQSHLHTQSDKLL